MTSRDKDFRFMAMHDLATNELEKETFKLDQNAEPRLVSQLFKLDDPANNVQENAVNEWYAVLMFRLINVTPY
jgi:hypothetical protein